ncbi:flagellar basal body rod protein FlgB [Methylomonas sp. AM2-LC]|uniref:flagellar basal body rod protein FlgB n=1 Tax=Methylomonas sp. AM2-LC TaxID=3153301 RepID=UPI003265085B
MAFNSLSIENVLSTGPQMLMLREKHMQVLASNLANADTPDYKARDLDFKQVFQQLLGNNAVGLKQTQQSHLADNNPLFGAELRFRIPQQSSLDGNTVEGHIEQAKYAEAMVKYQNTLQSLSGDFKDLMSSLKGQ